MSRAARNERPVSKPCRGCPGTAAGLESWRIIDPIRSRGIILLEEGGGLQSTPRACLAGPIDDAIRVAASGGDLADRPIVGDGATADEQAVAGCESGVGVRHEGAFLRACAAQEGRLPPWGGFWLVG